MNTALGVGDLGVSSAYFCSVMMPEITAIVPSDRHPNVTSERSKWLRRRLAMRPAQSVGLTVSQRESASATGRIERWPASGFHLFGGMSGLASLRLIIELVVVERSTA